jgi:hypothetical protein
MYYYAEECSSLYTAVSTNLEQYEQTFIDAVYD